VTSFEQPLAVETADIMRTLASLIGLPVPQEEIDGRCLDLAEELRRAANSSSAAISVRKDWIA